jgi:hypothetical protein
MFEEKLLEKVYVNAGLIQQGKKVEEELKSLLKKTGLRFKKVDAETYLILSPKAETTNSNTKPAPITLPKATENQLDDNYL